MPVSGTEYQGFFVKCTWQITWQEFFLSLWWLLKLSLLIDIFVYIPRNPLGECSRKLTCWTKFLLLYIRTKKILIFEFQYSNEVSINEGIWRRHSSYKQIIKNFLVFCLVYPANCYNDEVVQPSFLGRCHWKSNVSLWNLQFINKQLSMNSWS